MLRTHILHRLLLEPPTLEGGSYTPQQNMGLEILDDRLYRHKVIRFNYTTYDMRGR